MIQILALALMLVIFEVVTTTMFFFKTSQYILALMWGYINSLLTKLQPIMKRNIRIIRIFLRRTKRSLLMAESKVFTSIVTGVCAVLVYTFVAWVVISLLHPIAATIITLCLLFIVAILILLPLIPNATKRLSNDPNRFAQYVDDQKRAGGEYPGRTFGFFTELSPGQVKIIERGKRFITAIMKFDNHTFVGVAGVDTKGNSVDYKPNEGEYWEVIRTPAGQEDFYPVPDNGWTSWINPLWWWSRYVYKITGAVFTGIPPYQTVRIYPLTRLREILNPDGGISFARITDYSDHYRVADTQMFIETPDADTKDKIPVIVKKVQTVRIINPYSTAYNTDANWATRYFTAAADAINRFTRARPIEEVLTVIDEKQAGAFGAAVVKQLNRKTPKTGNAAGTPNVSSFGIKVTESGVLEITITDEGTRKRFEEASVAKVDAEARRIRGQGEADAVRSLIDAVTSKGIAGQKIFDRETLVRAAEAGGKGGGTVILDGGGSEKSVTPGLAFLQKSLEKGV